MKGNRALFLVVVAILTLHCGSGTPSGGPSGETTGSISLKITTVPSGVQCIQISVLGSTLVTENFSVTSGSSSSNLSLGQLPLGQVTVNGQAFAAACTAISGQTASWIADPDIVTLQAGVVSTLALTFRPNNPVGGSATFVGNVTSIGMGTQQVGLVFSDGSVRAAGQIPGFTTSGASFLPLSSLTNVVQFAPSSAPSAFQSNAFDCILLNSGAVQCWGDNTFGQLGNGTNTSSNTPTTVSGLPSTIAQIAVGQGHVCALTTPNPSSFYNATLYCWGRNDHGQLGIGSTTNVNTPHGVSNGGTTFIVASAFETCESGANCFGQNANGEIGNNSTTDQSSFFSGEFVGAVPTVAVGQAHACAARQDGTVLCWGANGSGQLGFGNTTEVHVPTAVTALSGAVQVAASLNSTCARRNDGSVWCWGDGTQGALGDGTGTVQTSPVQAVGLPASSAIYGGGGSYCSISKNQTVWCWGQNQGLQLANGTIDAVYVPTQLSL
jgi:hypothetical protein